MRTDLLFGHALFSSSRLVKLRGHPDMTAKELDKVVLAASKLGKQMLQNRVSTAEEVDA